MRLLWPCLIGLALSTPALTLATPAPGGSWKLTASGLRPPRPCRRAC